MQAPAVHRVRRLSWQVRAPTPALAFAMRSRLQAQTDALPALLERALDEVAGQQVPPDRVWKIPRLTLQLQLKPADLADAELQPRLAAALREALAALPAGHALGADGPPPGSTDAADGPAGPPAERPLRSTPQAEARAAFAHYLAWGDLPWPQQALPPEQQHALLRGVALDLLDTLRVAADAGAARHRLRTLLPAGDQRRPGALARWLALLPAPEGRSLVEAVVGHGAASPVAGSPPPLSSTGVDARIQAMMQALAMPDAAPGAGPAPAAQLHGSSAPAGGAGLASTVPQPAGPGPRAEARHGQHLAAPKADDDTPARHPVTPRTPGDAPAPGETLASQLVPLAGLVLLHPYLPRLLQARGLVGADEREIADAAMPRACALVHALAAGAAPVQEYALPFVKLLLGRAPDTPLDAALPVADTDDLAEAGALLAAVRAHWPALAGTGDEALRVSFLQRRGLLARSGAAWHLQMSREPFDLLLGLLPWGIGFVRTPWMRLPLTVAWPAT